jgi:hypothetical protein
MFVNNNNALQSYTQVAMGGYSTTNTGGGAGETQLFPSMMTKQTGTKGSPHVQLGGSIPPSKQGMNKY